MNIYTGPVAQTYAASVRFEVKSSISQLSTNIGTYMSAWQNTQDIVTLRLDLGPGEEQTGGACNLLFLWTSAPLDLTVTYPRIGGGPPQTVTVPVSSAFFIDSPITSWKITNARVNPVRAELTFAKAEPT